MMKTGLRTILICGTLMLAGLTLVWGDRCVGDGNNGTNQTTDGTNSAKAADPIDMSTGAFTMTRTDITLPGPMPITFTRSFDTSMGGPGGVLGVHWADNCHKFLTFGTIAAGYNRGDGVVIPLYADSHNSLGQLTANHCVSKQRPYYTLTSADLVHFVLNDKFGNSEYYQMNGYAAMITKAVDRNGNELDYTYDYFPGSGFYGNLLSVQDPVSGRSLSFTYDHTTGTLTKITDSAGRTVHYNYAAEADGGFYQYLSTATLPSTPEFVEGTTETYVYDTAENLWKVKDGNGNVQLINVYDPSPPIGSQPRVIQQTYNGSTSTLAYDDADKKVTFTDNKGYVTEYYSDGNRNILKKIVHAPSTPLHGNETATTTFETDYTYGTGTTTDGFGHLVDGPVPDSSQPNNCYKTKETDPNGNGTSWTYDANGNILTVTKFSPPTETSFDSTKGTQALTSTIKYTYEPRFNQVATVTDPNGKVTTNDYGDATSNPKGNLLSTTYPTTAAGTATESLTYNSKGQVLTHTTSDGVTQNTYDDTTGYLMTTIKDYSTGSGHFNATTQFTYDTWGNVASTQDPNGKTTNFSHNAQGQLFEIDGASGEVETKSYDENGNLTVDQKNAPGSAVQKTENIYNADQLLTATRQYTDATTYLETDYGYDANGNRTTVTDPLGHIVTTAYDERDKAYKVTDALGNTTTYDFDGNGNTVKLTDELSHVTTYAFDGIDRLEQKTFPDSSYQTWTYDATGNITGLRTTAGNAITQTFDTRNRMLTQVYPVTGSTSTITNTYDLMGRMLTSTEGGTALTYTYDALGRNTSFTDQAGRVSTYTYDLDGHRLNSTYPTSVTVKRAYDDSSRLSTLKDNSDATMATYSYDILDRMTGVTLANSTSVSYGYDLLSRLGSVDNTLGSGNRNYSYVYDNASRVTQTTEPRGTITSGYTDRNEVNSLAEPTGSPFADQGFVYDAGFNRSSWTLGSSTPGASGTSLTSYAVNNLNQYSTVSGSTAPTWNTDGGLAAFAGNTYTYDALQRLTEVDYSGGKTVFTYDPMGRRVKKVDVNGSGTVLATYQYHYDGSEVAVEYQPSTTWTYYLGLGLDQVVMRDNGSAKQWYYRDGHGSTSAVADNSGDVLENYEYNAQGQFQITNASGTDITSSGTAIGNDLLYTGRNYDYETGNYFYRARYYNPQLGRFISRDPLSGAEFSQGTNLYAYCRNNLLNASDPTGMCLKDLLDDLKIGAELAWGIMWDSPGNPLSANYPLTRAIAPDYTGASLNLTINSTPPGSLVGSTDTLQYNLPSAAAPIGSLTNTADVATGAGTGIGLTLNANFSNGVEPSGTVITSSVAGGDEFGASGSWVIGSNGGSTSSVGVGLGVGAGTSTSINAVTQNIFGK